MVKSTSGAALQVEPPEPQAESPRRPRGARARKLLVACLVSVVVLTAIVMLANPAELERTFVAIGWSGVLQLGMICMTTQVLRTCRFAVSIPEAKRPNLGRLFGIVSIHQFLNHLLPARLGEVSFPWLLGRHSRNSKVSGLSVLLVVRMQELLTLAVLFVCVLPLVMAGENKTAFLALWGGGVTVLLLVLNSMLPGLLALLSRLLRRLPLDPVSRPARLVARAREVAEAVETELRVRVPVKRQLLTFALTIGIWLTTFLLSYRAMRLSGIHVDYPQTIIGSSMSSLSNILPLNSFGSFGSLEVGWTFGFKLVGVMPREALATGFVLHILGLSYLAAAALPSWLWLETRLGSGSPRLSGSA